MTVPISHPPHDTGAMLRALLDEGYRVTFTQDPASSDYLADLTGPLGTQAAGLGQTPAGALASVWPLDEDLADEPGPVVDATAAAALAGKITVLREYVGRAAADGGPDLFAVLDRVSGDLGRISLILAAATEDIGDDTDDVEPYCTTCGQWVHMFHGYEGWRHFRGEGTAASPVELYEAGHKAMVAWTSPPGQMLAPADIAVIRDALADAYASQWHREEPAATNRADAYAALLDSITAETEGSRGEQVTGNNPTRFGRRGGAR